MEERTPPKGPAADGPPTAPGSPRRAGRDEPLLPPPGLFGPLNPTYRIKRRQQRIREELERSRAGGHRVPTWALAVILLAIIGAWITLIALS
jgi:hypothetical protein